MSRIRIDENTEVIIQDVNVFNLINQVETENIMYYINRKRRNINKGLFSKKKYFTPMYK
jgi:hypothetical protein